MTSCLRYRVSGPMDNASAVLVLAINHYLRACLLLRRRSSCTIVPCGYPRLALLAAVDTRYPRSLEGFPTCTIDLKRSRWSKIGIECPIRCGWCERYFADTLRTTLSRVVTSGIYLDYNEPEILCPHVAGPRNLLHTRKPIYYE